jgi:hypothetical protein
MKPIFKNIGAFILGFVTGSLVNMALISISGKIIPPPAGADIKTMEGLKASMHLFEPKHFIFPFLAHALGTLVGAFITTKVAATNKMKLGIGIGFAFLLGGITNILLLPSPTWFTLLDLTCAYLPMSYLGGKIALRKTGNL